MTDAIEPKPLSQRDRIVFAVLGAVYLVFTVAWLFAVQANQLQIEDRFQLSMIKFGHFFAIVAPALWFFATFAQISTRPRRLVSLAVGLVVLFPFPLFFGVSPI